MSKITLKQEAFCLAYLETGSASEAYRRAYDAQKMKAESVHETACILLKSPKVSARIEELRKPAREAALVTLENHLNDMGRLRDQAEKAGQFGAAVRAEECRGKAAGLYTIKTELFGPGGIPIQQPAVAIQVNVLPVGDDK